MDLATYTLLDDVIADIAKVQGQLEELKKRCAVAQITTQRVVHVPGQRDWRQDELGKLYGAVAGRTAIVSMLNLLAEHAGEIVTYGKVLERTGFTSTRQAGEIGAFTKMLNRLFNSKAWPFESWQSNYSDGDGTMRYRMSEQIADWWEELREES